MHMSEGLACQIVPQVVGVHGTFIPPLVGTSHQNNHLASHTRQCILVSHLACIRVVHHPLFTIILLCYCLYMSIL